MPRAGAAYTLRYGHDFWGATQLRFTYGQGIKEPRLYQSFGTDPCNPGNPNLLPEQSRTTYAGVEQQLDQDKIRVSGDYFYNQFRNIISFTFCFTGSPCPVTPPPGCPFGFGTYFNTDLARARGGHLAAEGSSPSASALHANYTYDDSRVLVSPNAFDPVADSRQSPAAAARQFGKSGAERQALRRFQGNIAGIFVGRRTDSDFLFPPLGLTSNPGYMRVRCGRKLSRFQPRSA